MLGLVGLFAVCRGRADEVAVPLSLQVDLLGKVLWYERTLQRSQQAELSIAILTRPKHLASEASAEQLEAQLTRVKALGGKPVRVRRVPYRSAEQTQRTTEGAYLLYLTPGLEAAVADIAAAIAGQNVLTICSFGGGVPLGAVMGFELTSSKPQIVINLDRARAQKLDFSAQFLRIAKVVP